MKKTIAGATSENKIGALKANINKPGTAKV
jgi:hypothetical protein